ncbi:hypothetical protein CERZMDRAFT_93902 [Cercospora zeae-maydis SCOH1-5]|uniref:Uncharacterized protein n=1 Tax=Cercospora zeae-maydis SCOH1-5 TaxID=717836 RepID=A0A6A6FT98_9PEZI|nr:hypothetical protein CERZMDRAFT_93902 [Cercospora zeae-maydis SCOH1-5]
MEESARLEKFEITDSRLEIDRSYDDSTVRFKLLTANAVSANLVDTSKLPFQPELVQTVKQQGWISDEYEHLWRRDEGGSAALTSHGILTFILQTPRDGKSFCSLSLVNRERTHCGGLFVADENYTLTKLLASQQYLNKHPKVPRDFAILPFQILMCHVEETLSQVRDLSRQLTNTERRLSDGRISLDDNGDYKLLNRFNLEHVRLQRRSNFEIELGNNLIKYVDAYQRLWTHLWEGGTGYLDDMREKIEQQMRYSEQVQKDLDMMPRRIDNQSQAIFNYRAQRDNQINLQVAESSRKIAEESRIDNLLNVKLARVTAQMAEETRQDSAAMKTIATMTLIFLPGTAVASFFGMDGMFNWTPSESQSLASPYIWVFFVVTIPLTLVVYGLWLWWFDRMEKEHKKNAPDLNFDMYEQEVERRMRTATNSWSIEKQVTMAASPQQA